MEMMNNSGRKPWRPNWKTEAQEDLLQKDKIVEQPVIQGKLKYEEMLAKYCENTLVWRTASKENFIIKDITDDHLQKLIDFLKEKDPEKKVNDCKAKNWILIIQAEKNLRENP